MEFDDKNYPGVYSRGVISSKYIKAKRKSIQKILFSFIYYKQIDEAVRLVYHKEVFGHVLLFDRAHFVHRYRL